MTDSGHPSSGRLKVLVSAYACGPNDEPEASAGWAFARAAAVHHDVWLVTRPRLRAGIDAALAADPELSAHLRVDYVEVPDTLRRLRRTPADLYWFYAVWQRLLARRAQALHARTGFDVVHHVTFANDWLPCGAAAVAGPAFVWGPVGGASRMPVLRLSRWLGARGTVTELVRTAATGLPRRLWGDRAARRAALVVAQNPDVAHRFRGARRVVVEPNAAFDVDVPERRAADPSERPAQEQRVAVFTGRLLAWKGGRLAVEAISRPEAAGWRLEMYGAGYEARALRRLVARLGVADRVVLHGHRPRAEVLEAFARADALLFPSMHDQAGWVAAEASALGCPVVCLPLGGPSVLAGPNAVVASLEGDVAGNLARALDQAAREGGRPWQRWSPDRLPDLLRAWYAEAAGA